MCSIKVVPEEVGLIVFCRKGVRRMHYTIYGDISGQWRWNLKSSNGRIIADSAESYRNKQDCLAAIRLVKGSSSAPVYEA